MLNEATMNGCFGFLLLGQTAGDGIAGLDLNVWALSTAAESWRAVGSLALRLVVAFGLGALVAWIYRQARRGQWASPTFPATLVLLAILIAMVTHVIGDNIARAFSLVGALSIVRFRTVVEDTFDIAFVIFAVVVGMAAGATSLWGAIFGTLLVGAAAWLVRPRTTAIADDPGTPGKLVVRMALGRSADQLIGPLSIAAPANDESPRSRPAAVGRCWRSSMRFACEPRYHRSPWSMNSTAKMEFNRSS